MAMKVISFKVEGNEVQLPSNASLVEGIDNAIDTHIAAYDSATVDAKIAGLSNVYLGKTAKAVDSAKADYATTAGKATNDGSGNQITTTYYKKTDTVDRAAADDQGNNFREKYAMKTGSVANASYATTAGAASKATLDSAGNNINTTYIKEITASGQTVTYKRGNNTTGTFTTKDTTYNAASTTTAGLMSAADKKKLDALSTDTGAYSVSSAGTATKLATARTISIGGGASGSASFDGSADAKISLGSINAASITSGTLAVARGGTGQTSLANVTVGKASKLETARTVALKGAVAGSTTFDGSANVTIATSALDVSTATAGTLAVARGGTGQTTLALARNAMGLGNTTGALPVANGGTGATSASAALTNLGAAAASHTHKYAGSSSAGGSATTADKLSTARTIRATGVVEGSVSFDGSQNVNIDTTINFDKMYRQTGYLTPTNNPDFNDITTSGWYHSVPYGKEYNNSPNANLNSSFDLEVRVAANTIVYQTVHSLFGSDMQYRRTRVNNNWTAWRAFAGEVIETHTLAGG